MRPSEGGLSAAALKYIAIAAMLIDHIAWTPLPIPAAWASLMHFFGRLTAPVMFYFIAEGYSHTRSLGKYFLRLVILALVSHVPFVYFESGTATLLPFSVILTLLLGLASIAAWDRLKSPAARILAVIAACALSWHADWSFFGVLMCLGFYLARGRPLGLALNVVVITLAKLGYIYLRWWTRADFSDFFAAQAFHLGMLLTIPLLLLYNGERGSRRSKWLFYVFYPAHLAILGLIVWRTPA